MTLYNLGTMKIRDPVTGELRPVPVIMGHDGGYYTPRMEAGKIYWTPSEEGMPEIPPMDGASEAQILAVLKKYLEDNPIEGGGVAFETGNALEMVDGVLHVVTTDEAEEDNTLPITSSGVHTIVGNISAILDTI